MKAFLLAAGNGTRLRPLTDTTPKCLLPIKGVPLLEIWLRLCQRYGIDEVLINVHAHAEVIRDYIARNRDVVGVKIFEEPTLLGSAGTLAANRQWVARDPLFWVFYADVLTNIDLGAMLQFHAARRPSATLGVYRVPDPSRCGIVNLDQDGVVTSFVEKPDNPSSDLAFSGVMVGTPELLNALPGSLPADIGFDVLGSLQNMSAYRIQEYLLDIGTVTNYRKAQLTWPGLS